MCDRLKRAIGLDMINMNSNTCFIHSKNWSSPMSALEIFLTFSLASTFAVAALATWLRFTNPPSDAKRG